MRLSVAFHLAIPTEYGKQLHPEESALLNEDILKLSPVKLASKWNSGLDSFFQGSK